MGPSRNEGIAEGRAIVSVHENCVNEYAVLR
jgi:hypothetical protein